MKKNYIIGFTLVWLFLFSLAAQASTVNGNRSETKAMRLTEAKTIEAKTIKEAEPAKAEENLVSDKELLGYVKELEEILKTEENTAVDQIGSLTLTEGPGKKRTKLFTGSKKLLGKGMKENTVNVVLFYVADVANGGKDAVILQENAYEIGASRIFSAEISLNRIGLNYLLIQVGSGEQGAAYQLYQIVVEDTKTKDKLESMTLQFTK